jgi:hypothetical protein
MASSGGPIPSLQAQLDAHKRAFLASLPRWVARTLTGGIDQLVRSGIAERALRVGEQAPDFELPDPTGRRWQLGALLAAGPVVLTFYRGVW